MAARRAQGRLHPPSQRPPASRPPSPRCRRRRTTQHIHAHTHTRRSCMMVDEAHERTLHTDVLFGLVKDIARFRCGGRRGGWWAGGRELWAARASERAALAATLAAAACSLRTRAHPPSCPCPPSALCPPTCCLTTLTHNARPAGPTSSCSSPPPRWTPRSSASTLTLLPSSGSRGGGILWTSCTPRHPRCALRLLCCACCAAPAALCLLCRSAGPATTQPPPPPRRRRAGVLHLAGARVSAHPPPRRIQSLPCPG